MVNPQCFPIDENIKVNEGTNVLSWQGNLKVSTHQRTKVVLEHSNFSNRAMYTSNSPSDTAKEDNNAEYLAESKPTCCNGKCIFPL